VADRQATLASTPAGTPQPVGVAGHWRLIFDDEFNDRSLDLRKWQPNWLGPTESAVTPPVTRFDLNCVAPTQVSEGGGAVSLSAAARSCTVGRDHHYHYASGLINTARSFTFTFGYLEARIYVPADSTGQPVDFPAFWATGTGPWPASGELDVMETLRGCGPGPAFHFHSGAGASGACIPAATSPGWHVFAAHWSRGAVSYLYDGRPVGTITRGITSKPMYLVLNNSVDPTYGASSAPSSMMVDYVRVWQSPVPAGAR
jgi:beta-glucanase (GH16 family)